MTWINMQKWIEFAFILNKLYAMTSQPDALICIIYNRRQPVQADRYIHKK